MRWRLKSWSEAISGLDMKRPPIMGRAAKPETLLRRTHIAMDNGQACTFPHLETATSACILEISRGMLK